jgi:hypothetical protein
LEKREMDELIESEIYKERRSSLEGQDKVFGGSKQVFGEK